MNGYILESKSIIESDIWQKPPLYFKVWHYLLLKAQYTDYKGLKRGQLITSIPEIQQACAYKVGYRTVIPSKKEIWGILEYLRNPYEGTTKVTTKVPMIVTTKVTHGMLVTICKYCEYQDPRYYEGNDEGNNEGTTKEQRRERQGNNINKENKKKNNKKNNKESLSDVVASAPDELHEVLNAFIDMRKVIKAPLTPYALRRLLSQADRLSGGDLVKKKAIFDQSIQRGWRGVFDLVDPIETADIKKDRAEEARRKAKEEEDRLVREWEQEAKERSAKLKQERSDRPQYLDKLMGDLNAKVSNG